MPLVALLLSALVLLAGLGTAGSGAARAQEGFQPDANDVLWAFAAREPFDDLRVAAAFAVRIDVSLIVPAAGLPIDSRLIYGDARVRPLLSMTQTEAGLLLAATINTGRDARLLQFGELRPCRLWTAPAGRGSEVDQETRLAIAASIAGRLQVVMSELGVGIQPCVTVEEASAADLLVWTGADATPARAGGAGFLGFVEREVEGEEPASDGAAADPGMLPLTGTGGLADAHDASARSRWDPGMLALAAGTLAATLLAAGVLRRRGR